MSAFNSEYGPRVAPSQTFRKHLGLREEEDLSPLQRFEFFVPLYVFPRLWKGHPNDVDKELWGLFESDDIVAVAVALSNVSLEFGSVEGVITTSTIRLFPTVACGPRF